MSGSKPVAFVVAVLSAGCAAPRVARDGRLEEVGMRNDEQRPQDPGAIGDLMAGMKRAADEVVSKTEPGRDAKAAYRRGAIEIMRRMRPRFGPANAWLFNERSAKLGELADKLGVGPDDARSLFEEHVYEAFFDQFEALGGAVAEAGLTTAERPADRAELLWSPLPGYALSVIDESAKVRWKPPYAGTVAGPDVPEIEAHPRVTLYCFPPVAGSAVMNLMAREQPGRPAFYTGELVAMVLQEPQSGDVRPDAVMGKLMPELERAGLTREIGDEQAAAIAERLGWPATASHGIVSASVEADLPDDVSLPVACALVWARHGGVESRLELLFPTVKR